MNHSLGHQERTLQPSGAPDEQSPAEDPDPWFPLVEHGKWGYIDKTGKIVIKPEYIDAGPFKEGSALHRGHGIESRLSDLCDATPHKLVKNL